MCADIATSAEALASRRSQVRAKIIGRDTGGYGAARKVYHGMIDRRPAPPTHVD
jgi:hypothetical protein